MSPSCIQSLLGVILILVINSAAEERVRNVWTSWSDWSRCSMTCGQGTKSRRRECVGQVGNKLVRLAEAKCNGLSNEHVVCVLRDCYGKLQDLRGLQCSEHDSEKFLGHYYKWIPHKGPNICELTCKAQKYNFFYHFGHVRDGTSCGDNGEVCANGVCATIGCDGRVGSNAVLDKCGVCDGGNVDCVHVKKRYTAKYVGSVNYGYNEITKIPTGAKYILVEDKSSNFLALADSAKGYIFNGHFLVDWPGKYRVAGSTFHYNRIGHDNETLKADGPTTEDLYLMVVLRGINPGITYEYWAPTRSVPLQDRPASRTAASFRHRRIYGSKGAGDVSNRHQTGTPRGSTNPVVSSNLGSSSITSASSNDRVSGDIYGFKKDRASSNHRASSNLGASSNHATSIIHRVSINHRTSGNHGASNNHQDYPKEYPEHHNSRDFDKPYVSSNNKEPGQSLNQAYWTQSKPNSPNKDKFQSSFLGNGKQSDRFDYDSRVQGHKTGSLFGYQHKAPSAGNARDKLQDNQQTTGQKRPDIHGKYNKFKDIQETSKQQSQSSNRDSTTHRSLIDQGEVDKKHDTSEHLKSTLTSHTGHHSNQKLSQNGGHRSVDESAGKHHQHGRQSHAHGHKRKHRNLEVSGNCGTCLKAKGRTKHYCHSDFVIRGKIRAVRRIGNETRYDVQVIDIYRNSLILLEREFIWTPDRCRCPYMEKYKEYIIMGKFLKHDKLRESRLEVHKEDFVRDYSASFGTRLRKLGTSLDCTKIS